MTGGVSSHNFKSCQSWTRRRSASTLEQSDGGCRRWPTARWGPYRVKIGQCQSLAKDYSFFVQHSPWWSRIRCWGKGFQTQLLIASGHSGLKPFHIAKGTIGSWGSSLFALFGWCQRYWYYLSCPPGSMAEPRGDHQAQGVVVGSPMALERTSTLEQWGPPVWDMGTCDKILAHLDHFLYWSTLTGFIPES